MYFKNVNYVAVFFYAFQCKAYSIWNLAIKMFKFRNLE